jgi:hypothetical protein
MEQQPVLSEIILNILKRQITSKAITVEQIKLPDYKTAIQKWIDTTKK